MSLRIGMLATAIVAAIAASLPAATLNDFLTADLDGSRAVKLQTADYGLSGQSDDVYRNTNSLLPGANGGEFRVQVYNSTTMAFEDVSVGPLADTSNVGPSWIYKTFCVEPGETFNPNTAYYATIDPKVYYGTDAGDGVIVGASEILNDTVKLGYALYMEGLLDQYSGGAFSYQDDLKAAVFQQLIWDLQNVPLTAPAGSMLTLFNGINAYDGAYGSAALLKSRVYVLNLWNDEITQLPHDLQFPPTSVAYGNKSPVQSQLFYSYGAQNIPGTPEPMSLAIWGAFGGVGLGYAAYRRKGRK